MAGTNNASAWSPAATTLLVPVMVAFAATTLTSCKTRDKDAPPKRLKHNYRDAVEQRVFYDGWFER
jgi:hypothetical protein